MGYDHLSEVGLILVDGNVVAQTGGAPVWAPAGRAPEYIQQRLGVNDSGGFTFSGEMDGLDPNDEFVAVGDGLGNITLEAMEGTQVNGGFPGWISRDLNSPVRTATGVGYHLDNTGGLPQGLREMILVNGTVAVQSGVDAPLGQFTSTPQYWNNFVGNGFFFSADATKHTMLGDLEGPNESDRVFVVNGTVAIQESYPIPGGDPLKLVSNRMYQPFMADNGDWMVAGGYQDGEVDWVAYNGVEVAREHDPILPGSSTHYLDVFSNAACNQVGDYVVGGRVDGPANTNSVLVLNGRTLICREGDPVDLDGNGLFDDDVYFSQFRSGGANLTDDLRLFLSGNLRNSSGTDLGGFLALIDVAGIIQFEAFCDPMNPNSSGLSTSLGGTPIVGPSSGVRLEMDQGPAQQFGYFLVGTASNAPGLVLGSGRLCLALTPGNVIGRYNVAGGGHNSIGLFDNAGVFQNLAGSSASGLGFDIPTALPLSGAPSIQPGQTWYFQGWHRDIGGASNFSNGLSVTF
ncbi:MAG: hypothetical protein P1V35_02405 [Planctomycetota bacterium]|nr:hypothetical protein [Planctomycetota bacterium]